MKSRDYRCNCGNIREIVVPDGQDFPNTVPCLKCDGVAKKIYTPAYTICHQGSVGNAKNGYTSTGGNIKKS